MMLTRVSGAVALWACLAVAGPVRAEDPCAAFSWDVGQERALFASAPQVVPAGSAPAGAPARAAGRLYQMQLTPQAGVSFAAPPAKKMLADGAYAGVATLTVATAGVYRISLDQPFWLDVAANGVLIPSKDFQGRAGCTAPHKIVEFELPAATPLVLQVSNGTSTTVKVAITPVPTGMP